MKSFFWRWRSVLFMQANPPMTQTELLVLNKDLWENWVVSHSSLTSCSLSCFSWASRPSRPETTHLTWRTSRTHKVDLQSPFKSSKSPFTSGMLIPNRNLVCVAEMLVRMLPSACSNKSSLVDIKNKLTNYMNKHMYLKTSKMYWCGIQSTLLDADIKNTLKMKKFLKQLNFWLCGLYWQQIFCIGIFTRMYKTLKTNFLL